MFLIPKDSTLKRMPLKGLRRKMGYLLPMVNYASKFIFSVIILELRWVLRFYLNKNQSDTLISIATTSSRHRSLTRTLKSLLTQDSVSAKIIIWTSEADFDFVTSKFAKFAKYQVEIKKAPRNLRSYNKFHHTAKEYLDSDVICVDDDIIFRRCWLSSLLNEAQQWPGYIIGSRGIFVDLNTSGVTKKYVEWESAQPGDTGNNLVLNTGAGTYYPRRIFSEKLISDEMFLQIAPTSDDLWMFAMSAVENIPRRISFQATIEFQPAMFREKNNLWRINVQNSQNDRQFAMICDHFSMEISPLNEKNLSIILDRNHVSTPLLGNFSKMFAGFNRVSYMVGYKNRSIVLLLAGALINLERAMLQKKIGETKSNVRPINRLKINQNSDYLMSNYQYTKIRNYLPSSMRIVVTQTENLFSAFPDPISLSQSIDRSAYSNVRVMLFRNGQISKFKQGKFNTKKLVSENLHYSKNITLGIVRQIFEELCNTDQINPEKSINNEAQKPSLVKLVQYFLYHAAKYTFSQKKKPAMVNWKVRIDNIDGDDDLQNYWELGDNSSAITADPFLFESGQDVFCFVEEVGIGETKGNIVVYQFKEEKWIRLGVCLTENYHLSYPYIFEFEEEIYMLPESSDSDEINLYKAVDFPMKWVKFNTLINSVSAADSMIVKFREKWCLLSNVDSFSLGDHCTELHLWTADNPLSSEWKSFSGNPIYIDSSKARNGGLISDGSKLIRVAQDSNSGVYGKSFGLYEILEMNDDTFAEIEIHNNFILQNVIATHHMSKIKDFIARDFIAGEII